MLVSRRLQSKGVKTLENLADGNPGPQQKKLSEEMVAGLEELGSLRGIIEQPQGFGSLSVPALRSHFLIEALKVNSGPVFLEPA
jgi:hypothetical protein